MDEIKELTAEYFNLQNIHLIEYHEEYQHSPPAGTILARGEKAVRDYIENQKRWTVFLAVLKKK